MNTRQAFSVMALMFAFYMIMIETHFAPDPKLFSIQVAGLPPYAITLTMFTLLIGLFGAVGKAAEEALQ